MAMEKLTDVLTKHGWPPATLTIVVMLAGALYMVYQDHRQLQDNWRDLAESNLKANLEATLQRTELQKMLETGMQVQHQHLKMIRDMETTRIQQNQLDQQLTAAAVQALRQIADKTDVQLQMHKPEEILELNQHTR